VKRQLSLALGLSMFFLTACTGTQHGTAVPAASSSTPSSMGSSGGQLPGPGVPAVADALDTTRFQQEPCTTLTDAQVAGLLGPNAQPHEDLNADGGPGCFWHPSNVTQAAVSVIYNTKNKGGLTTIYEKQGTTFPLFIPMDPINGYPTVAYGLADQRTSDGKCAVALGTSNQDVIDVAVALSEGKIDKKDPCAAAHEVAATVLSNLRAE
jgi:hypothetical protein